MFRKSGLSNEQAKFMASEFKGKNMLTKSTKVTLYRNRKENFRKYFEKDLSLFHCINMKGLMDELKPNIYKPGNCRLFIDSSKRSLKAILLHIINKYASIPVAHLTVLIEEYSNLEVVLKKIKYQEHLWLIYGDFLLLLLLLAGTRRVPKH